MRLCFRPIIRQPMNFALRGSWGRPSKLQARVQAKQKLASAATVSQTASASPQPNLTASKQDLMRQAGIPESDWAYTDYIVSKESSWNSNAVNKSSGAFRLAQCLNKPADSLCYSKNPVDQLKWQKQYVQERYGSYANAHKLMWIWFGKISVWSSSTSTSSHT